jgi:hypothetical protein
MVYLVDNTKTLKRCTGGFVKVDFIYKRRLHLYLRSHLEFLILKHNGFSWTKNLKNAVIFWKFVDFWLFGSNNKIFIDFEHHFGFPNQNLKNRKYFLSRNVTFCIIKEIFLINFFGFLSSFVVSLGFLLSLYKNILKVLVPLQKFWIFFFCSKHVFTDKRS